ncbi:phage tail assembly protein [Chromobacterium haemolyticum]|uniref:phage tail assembly protein n=1 Tax=Chromobacterium haemolyticum TaxID=394935 RepID=UPI0017471E29|nr:phage tail assembly protein [Chromobacterium haemolyticum]QOD81892.1 phage tail assembly protein [Chromobacterium haemolyticum]
MSQNQKSAGLAEVKLSDGRVARVVPFKGKHIRFARRMQVEAGHDFLFALIAQTTTIDGQGIVPEELDEMDGKDVVKLQAAVEGN